MAFAPDGWTALETGIADWLRTSVPAGTLWGWASDAKRPKLAFPFVLAEFIGPPRHTFFAGHKARFEAVRINTAAVQTYTITLDNGPVSYAAPIGGTVTSIRNALLALIPGATAYGADMLLLPSTRNLVVGTPVAPYPDIVAKLVKRQETRGECTLQVDAYATTTTAAFGLCLHMEASIETYAGREILNTAGWGFVRIANARSLPYFEAGAWLGRAAFDVILSCRYEIDEVIDYIESAVIQSIHPAGGALTGEVFG